MIAERERVTIQPTGTRLHVRYTKPAEQTPGGIWLPDEAQENNQEAEVLAVGPGLEAPDGTRGVMWVSKGDLVLFRKQDFVAIGQDEGFVHEEKLLGVIDPFTNEVTPLNDWVKLRFEEKVAAKGSIEIPEHWQRRPNYGMVVDMGYGRLCLNARSPFYGSRLTTPDIAGITKADLLGRRAYFDADAELLEVGSDWVDCWLVRVGDILFVTEN